MVVGVDVDYWLRNSKRNSFLFLFLLLLIFLIVGEKSTASIEKLTETDESINRSNISLDNSAILDETKNKTKNMIISIPSVIILIVFIIFLSYVSRQKQNYRINSGELYTSGRLMQLGQQNNCKESESVKFIRSNLDTEICAVEVKPLRNISEESELSRSVMASVSSE